MLSTNKIASFEQPPPHHRRPALVKPPPHRPRSDIVVDLLATVIVVARAVDLVVLVAGETPVPVGAGAVKLSVMSPFLHPPKQETQSEKEAKLTPRTSN